MLTPKKRIGLHRPNLTVLHLLFISTCCDHLDSASNTMVLFLFFNLEVILGSRTVKSWEFFPEEVKDLWTQG